ncbi:MAG: hypothetical protein KDD29_02370 [Flavobacteriales bacterium]|nr:hypothetical protein [Flavobacteriales bacterium]MCB9335533.1 hypothetical protein [Flavobacteriales bacterium]
MQQRQIPEWLKNLQENSWELELLISGGAIFSLFQISDIYVNWLELVGMIAGVPGRAILLMTGMIGIKVLTLGFIIHLSLRAYWLALVCINFVYPNGINTEKIKWKSPFKNKLQKGDDLQDQITYVDKQCGTVMFMSIISIFVLLGLTLVFMGLIGIMVFLESNTDVVSENVFTILFIFFLAYVFDLLSFGLLRKIPVFSYLVFPIFKLYDTISFRSYYAKALLMFNTNVVKWKYLIKALIFSFIAITSAYLAIYKTMHWPNLFDQREYRYQMADNDYIHYSVYLDEWIDGEIGMVAINSKVQTGTYMELFVTYFHRFDELIEQTSEIDSLKTFDKILEVQIDTTICEPLIWFPAIKHNNIRGVTTMIPIDSLSNGHHTIYISSKLKYLNEQQEAGSEEYKVKIPFWVDK